MTALRIALCGECRYMMFSLSSGPRPAAVTAYSRPNIAGRMAKYFDTSFAMLNVVSAPRVISNCLPISTTSMSFVGLESRSTMLPASRAAWVPVFIATPTSACASAGASFVPSPIIAISRPPACSWRMRASLSSGLACAMKSSTPASAAIAAAVNWLSPVIITVRTPILRNCAKRSLMPPFTMSFRWMTPRIFGPSATTSGVPPSREIFSTSSNTALSAWPPCSVAQIFTASAAPLRMRRVVLPSFRSSPLIRVWAVNGMNCACGPEMSRPRRPYFSFASTAMDRPSGVSSASEASCAASASSSSFTPGAGTNSVACRLPSVMVPVLSSNSTSTSPAASTARPEVASTFRRMSRSMPAIPIALSNPPMVVGIRQTINASSTGTDVSTTPFCPAAASL